MRNHNAHDKTTEPSNHLMPVIFLAAALVPTAGVLGYTAAMTDTTPSPQEICNTSGIGLEEILRLNDEKARVDMDRLKYAADIAQISDAMASDGLAVEPFEIDLPEYLRDPSAANELTTARLSYWNAAEESENIHRKIAALFCEQEE